MLKGKRIILNRIREEDWELRYQWLNDPEVNVSLSAGLGIPLSAGQVKEQVSLFTQESAKWAYFTVSTHDNVSIGAAQLMNIDPWARRAELGLFIGNGDYRGKGYGEEITRLMVEFAFERLNLHKVWLTVDEDNPVAIRCYMKVGFRQDGILRDEVVKENRYLNRILMSILQDEYEPAHPEAFS